MRNPQSAGSWPGPSQNPRDFLHSDVSTGRQTTGNAAHPRQSHSSGAVPTAAGGMTMRKLATILIALGLLAGCATTGGVGLRSATDRLEDTSQMFYRQL